jgi:spermidine synthase
MDANEGEVCIGQPVVADELGFLALHLNDGNFQSLMRKSRPYRLELGYTRTMMGFLLFNSKPQHIAMIGLGGGSMPKYCYRHLRDTRITVVEINPGVIALREHFHVPADDERFSVICADGADYVAKQHATLDVLAVDGFDTGGQVPQLCSHDFYAAAHNSLRDDGVMVVNTLGSDPNFEAYLDRIRHCFGDAVAVAPSEDCANRIVFATKGRAVFPVQELTDRAIEQEQYHQLKLQALAAQLVLGT